MQESAGETRPTMNLYAQSEISDWRLLGARLQDWMVKNCG